MPNLTIKNFPDELYERIKARALAERRSFNAQAIVLLEHYLTRDVAVRSWLAEQARPNTKRKASARRSKARGKGRR